MDSDSDVEENEGNDFLNIWNRGERNQQEPNVDNNITIHHNCIATWKGEYEGVTTLYRCKASNAKVLYIFDSAYKIQQNDQYDIGGAYGDKDTGLWFFFTTSSGPGRYYLMNMFVSQKKPGAFSVGISNSNTLTTTVHNKYKVRTLSEELMWQNFNSTQPDEVNYIKTFCFTEEDRVLLLKMVLVIPISIVVKSKTVLIKEIVDKIKTQVDFGENLLKDQERDIVLKSREGREFKAHRIVVAAHSPKLRDMLRVKDCKTLNLDIGNYEVIQLLQYLYTGNIKDMLDQQHEMLLLMADKFQLNNLREIVKRAMKLSIDSENVLETAVMAEKHNCIDVQEVAFSYIAQHPEVLDSDAFSKLDNTTVIKKLLRYIHVKSSQK